MRTQPRLVKPAAAAVVAVSLGLALASCAGEMTVTGPGWATDPYGTADPALDPAALTLPDVCGGQTIPIELKHNGELPDLHLVVDRSGSMLTPISFFDFFRSKWMVMRDTLSAMVSTFQGKIRFGLTLYPGDDSCMAGAIDVPLQIGNEQQIKQQLQRDLASGWTPTHTTLAAVRSYLRTVPPGEGPRHVLLATDGIPNCGAEPETTTDSESLAEIGALAAEGISTFVLGFGDVIFSSPALLDKMAVAGGRINPSGPHKFYPATNEQELKDALFSIAAGIIPPPCTYQLTSQPEDPERVTVTFDDEPVPRSLSNTSGWNYSAGGSEISFHGDACQRLQAGQVEQVRLIFGCTGPVIK